MPWGCLSSDLTVAGLQDDGNLSKPLNLRGFLEPGTHLAAIRDKNVRMTQTRLGDSLKAILDYSFRYAIDTDLRKLR
jgi:hypothetical protein